MSSSARVLKVLLEQGRYATVFVAAEWGQAIDLAVFSFHTTQSGSKKPAANSTSKDTGGGASSQGGPINTANVINKAVVTMSEVIRAHHRCPIHSTDATPMYCWPIGGQIYWALTHNHIETWEIEVVSESRYTSDSDLSADNFPKRSIMGTAPRKSLHVSKSRMASPHGSLFERQGKPAPITHSAAARSSLPHTHRVPT